MMFREALGFVSPDTEQAGEEGLWLWEQFDEVDDYETLWLRYLRLCDQINDTHEADDWDSGDGREPAEVD
jgi:hypothetical protein